MSTKLEFYLEDSYVERLLAVKEEEGKDIFSVNEFAKELLERELYRLHEAPVKYDENVNRIK